MIDLTFILDALVKAYKAAPATATTVIVLFSATILVALVMTLRDLSKAR
jgi:hypothetical protein